jgi:hypothetical protein
MLRPLVIALVIDIAGAGLGLASRSNSDGRSPQTAGVIKAGKPIVTTSSDALVIR